jgi:galactokinase
MGYTRARTRETKMPKAAELKAALGTKKTRSLFRTLYGVKPGVIDAQVARYSALLDSFTAAFPADDDVAFYSTPGRTEVGGNHTDHNAGRVLAAAVDLDVAAVAARSPEPRIVIESEGYPRHTVEILDLVARESEKYTSIALTRGICARFRQLGYAVGGFNACMASRVLKGSGLSSSAAYEVMVATILNCLYNAGSIPDVEIARIAQFSENHFFGKPCGLMDQTTCQVGGFVTIDFRDFARPIVRKVDYDFASSGYALVIVDTGGSHADLTEDYTALENEMKAVARTLGGNVLREFSRERLLAELPLLRGRLKNDRAILRALHFYDDDRRVVEQVDALERRDFPMFLGLVVESGRSSWMLCQNCYSHKTVPEQGISVALAMSENLLRGRGAWRVHGGGFAGTIQAFVPGDLTAEYALAMKKIFGEESCHELMVRPLGSLRLEIA